MGTAYLEVIPSARGFASKLQGEVGGQMTKAGKDAGTSAAKGFGSTWKTGIKSVIGTAATLFAGAKVIGFLGDSLGEARDAQKVGAQTEAVIKSTGAAAGVSAKQVGDLSTAISNKVGIDDEAIQSGANLLLTFTNIRNEAGKGNDIFNQATQAITDMGAAMGGDPKSSAIQLGKALNDPVKGITALSRVGVSFTAQQKDQIKVMVATGDTASAQKVILAELAKEFGGSAEAQATAADKAEVSLGNLKETVGTALLPVMDDLSNLFTDDIAPAITDFITGMQDGTGAGGEFADIIGTAKDVLTGIAGFIKDNTDLVIALAAGIAGYVVAQKLANTYTVIAGAVSKVYAAGLVMQAGATETTTASQWSLNAALTANPIGLIVVAVGLLVAGFVLLYKKSDTFRALINGLWKNVLVPLGKFIGKVFVGYLKLLASMWLTMGEFGVKAFRLLLTAAFAAFGGILDAAAAGLGWLPGIGGKVKAARDAFKEFGDDTIEKLKGVEQSLHDTRDAVNGIPLKKTIDITVNWHKGDAIQGLVDPTFGGSGNGLGVLAPDSPKKPTRPSPRIVVNDDVHVTTDASATPRTANLVVGDRSFDSYIEDVVDRRIGSAQATTSARSRMDY